MPKRSPYDSAASYAANRARREPAPQPTIRARGASETQLSTAVQRLDKEVQRREKKSARQALIESATRALEMRRASDAKAARPNPGRMPSTGMQTNTSSRSRTLRNRAKAGAISQHLKNIQAKSQLEMSAVH